MPRPSTRGRRAAANDHRRETIDVAVSGSRPGAVSPRWLAGVVRKAVAAIGRTSAEISVRLIDDAGIADLHERWLGIPGPTDVITFDLAEPGDAGLRGDIAISVETAARMAGELGWEVRHEAAYYAVHGLLHLAGEDDHAAADRRRMRARERVVLERIGLPCPPTRRPSPSRRAP